MERARERAAANKLSFVAVQSDMFKFDYGTGKYDLVLFMYMGPVGDLGERLVRALKPGGHLLIEHFAGGFESGSLPTVFKGLEVLRYSEDEDSRTTISVTKVAWESAFVSDGVGRTRALGRQS